MASEDTRRQIIKNKEKIAELHEKNRALEKKAKQEELEEIHNAVKAAEITPKEVKELLEAYAKGNIDLPEELQRELEKDDEE